MLGFQRTNIDREALISADASPRLRQVLAQQLKTASPGSIERLSWMFWLLRMRQPKRLMIDGQFTPPEILMTAAALSLGRTGRIHHAQGVHDSDTASVLQAAGLECLCAYAARSAAGADRIDALLLGTMDHPLIDCLERWTPRLSAGALIIGLGPELNRAQTQSLCRELLERNPGLESFILAPEAVPLLTLIWRGH